LERKIEEKNRSLREMTPAQKSVMYTFLEKEKRIGSKVGDVWIWNTESKKNLPLREMIPAQNSVINTF